MNDDWLMYLESMGATITDGRLIAYPGAPSDADGRIINLDHLGSAHITGADAASFLQGQLTNDVALSTPDRAQLSAWCTPKGRVQMLFWLFEYAGGYQLLMPTELAPGLLARLGMFVLRAKVKIGEGPADRVRIGVTGTDAVACLEHEVGGLPGETGALIQTASGVCVLKTMGPPDRYEILAPVFEAKQLWQKLTGVAAVTQAHHWTAMDIEAGMPLVTPAAVDEYLPQMLNLMALNGINLEKGCYVGQEIVARAHYRGKVKRRLYSARCTSKEAPTIGADILQGEPEVARPVGKVLASEVTDDDRCALLAVMSVEDARQGRLHLENNVEVSLASLPYAVESS